MWHFAMAVLSSMTKVFIKGRFSQERHQRSWLVHQALGLLQLARNNGHLTCANGWFYFTTFLQ